ncbi:MAG TPA: BatD family protein [Elusimicrobiales bacterium]|nr:BatD family protein [Elusimicrobiales bacterium]
MKNFTFKITLISILILNFFSLAYAEISLRAYVDKTEVTLNGYLTFSVEVKGEYRNIEKPTLPTLPNFEVYSSGQSQSVSIINGKVSSSITYKYTLTPRFVGKALIDAVTLTHQGVSYLTDPITITVLRPDSKSSRQTSQTQTSVSKIPQAVSSQTSGKDVFITAWVNKKTAFPGEQVTLTIRFYHAVAIMGNPNYVQPSFDNFLSEDLPPNRDGVEEINGREYRFIEVKTALFGVSAGEGKITPAEVAYRIRKDVNLDPSEDDFVKQFFSLGVSNGVVGKSKTKPITVTIEPFPVKNKPQNFKGAVGEFSISASLDKEKIKRGDLANLTVRIVGKGDLKTVTAPALPRMDNLHFYDTVISLNVSKKDNIVRGSKNFKTVISAKNAGKFVILPIEFSYFNPKTKDYVEVATLPITFEVLPSERKTRVKYTFSGGGDQITALDRDINYIKENASAYKSSFFSSINSLGKWNFIAVFLLLSAIIFYCVDWFRSRNPQMLKERRSYSLAMGHLNKAKKLISHNKSNEAIDTLSKILSEYLCTKVGCGVSAITNKEIIRLLKARYPGLNASLINEVKHFWEHLDMLKFAPVSEKVIRESRQVIGDLKTILSKLERKLKK